MASAKLKTDDTKVEAAKTPPSIILAQRQEVLDKLAELGGRLTGDDDLAFEGRRFIIPDNMTLKDAVSFLEFKVAEEDKPFSFSRTFNYRPWDGAYATMNAFKRAFGTYGQKAIQTFFGDRPPEMRTINVGPHETTQVPWGKIVVPSLPGCEIYTGATRDAEMGILYEVTVQGPRKWRFHIEGLFALIEDELETHSLYRGKAIDGQDMPLFLDLDGVDPEKVVYSQHALDQLDANLWSLLRWSDRMRELNVPLKRAVLLEGPYGTGKTLAAYLTAKIAVEHGWTFIYCRPGRDNLLEVMSTARLYQPAVVFFEDVDTAASPEAGAADHTSQMLDMFDGIAAKGTEIVVVLTTNHKEKIHKGMVRPGRLDAVIHIGTLDPAGIQRLIRVTIGPDHLSADIDWADVAGSMDGYTPAFVREAADRTIRYVLSRNEGTMAPITTADLTLAAEGLRDQLELMEGAHEQAARPTIDQTLSAIVEAKLAASTIVDQDNDYWGKIVPVDGTGHGHRTADG